MSCQTEAQYSEPLARLLSAARARVRIVRAQSALTRLDRWLVLDVREATETLFGYLPFAINIPRGQLEFYFAAHPEIPYARTILVYSNRGHRSLLAAQTLRQLGYQQACSLDGGIARWSGLGMPLE